MSITPESIKETAQIIHRLSEEVRNQSISSSRDAQFERLNDIADEIEDCVTHLFAIAGNERK